MSEIKLRFAPSPTGFLHVGNIRTALICWLYTKSHNGKLILRMDDTDIVRSKQEYKDQIMADLKWLGLDWDEYHEQLSRIERYNEISDQLITSGRLYKCYETPEELSLKKKLLLSRGLPPIYDREGYNLTQEKINKFEQEGRKPHWRFKLDDDKIIEWNDEIRGNLKFDANKLSDPVIIRADGSYTYMLPSTIDDIDMKITHVIRGEDHINNTAIQIQMFEAISDFVPNFAHVSFVKAKDQEISKRYGGFDIKSLREHGIDAMVINSLFGTIGTSHDIELKDSLEDLINIFDIKKYSKSSVYYDIDDLERLNIKFIHNSNFNKIRPKLDELKIKINESFWDVIKVNLSSFSEAKEWQRICESGIKPIITAEDKNFCDQIAELLPDEPWDNETWPKWIALIKQSSDRKGKNLFMPIRRALTASESGPELKNMLPLIGYEKTYKRLRGIES